MAWAETDDRARVRDVGQQRAEQHGHLHAERLGQVDDGLGERAPAERGLGAGEQDQVARGARDADGVDLELGPVDRARDAVLEAHHRARGLEVDELLGVDLREGLGAEAAGDEGQGGGRGLARVVPALERADQRRGPKPIGTAFPTQRLHPIHGTASAASATMDGMSSPPSEQVTIAGLRAGDMVDAVFACSRKDRLTARSGTPYLALELRDRTGRDRRRARSRTPTCWPGASSAATSCGSPAASSASATSCSSRSATSSRPSRPIRRRSCPSPTATSTSSTASSSTSRARSTTRPTRRCCERLLDDDALRAEWRRAPCTRGGHHAYLGGLLEHTVAVGTLALEMRAAAPASESGPAAHRRARARPRQDARVHLRRRDRADRRGPAARPRRARPADPRRATRCPTTAGSRSRTASSPTTGRRTRPAARFGSAEALALYRLNALDASVKGALEHGLP